MKPARCGFCRHLYSPEKFASFLQILCPQCQHPLGLNKNHPETVVPPFTVSPELLQGTLFGHYEIIDRIDEGGMAILYWAYHKNIKGDFALKILKPQESHEVYEEDILRFYHEFRSASKLNHPHIIKVYEAGLIKNLHFFSMELLSGYSVADLLAEQHQLTEAESLRLVIPIAQALQHAHKKKVYHRDIKPENILFREQNVPILTDFGLAQDEKLDQRLSESGFTLGTPDYMSPEQALSKPCGPEADIYSLGVVLYELVSGKVPYPGKDPHEIMDKVVHGQPIPLDHVATVSPLYQQMVMKCIAKKPVLRYRKMKGLLEDLQRLEQGKPLQLGKSRFRFFA
ncbi:MAG: serine/threonine-protein kinase [Planctomycetota bacterium]